MLTSNHTLLSAANSDSPLTPINFLSASIGHRHKMSHVPSLVSKESHHNHHNHHLSNDALCSPVLADDDHSPFNDFSDSPGATFANSESNIEDSKLSPSFARNKRKNFQPRCISDEQEEFLSGVDSQKQNRKLSSCEESNDIQIVSDKSPESTMFANSSLTETILGELINSLHSQTVNNGKATDQPLDLSSQDQLQQSKQLSELLFIKNIASLYPQLSSLQENIGKTPAPPNLEPSTPTKEDPTREFITGAPFSQLDTESEHAELSTKDNSLEELFHLYNLNHEQYLKLGEQQQVKKSIVKSTANITDTSPEMDSDDQESQPSLPDSLDKDDGDAENDLTMETDTAINNSNTKTIDIEKLKHLQNLYKLNLMQQINSNNCKNLIDPIINVADSSFMSSLEKSFQKSFQDNNSPIGGMRPDQSDTSNDNTNYFKDLLKSKVNNTKTASRRPLSSWKQSISACGPGPAPWVDKTTLYSLGIQGELINKSGPIDYTHYVKRYANALECGNNLCKELNYREHFHCNALSCNSRVFMKKEEMIRHFKWHKKRDESLTHGFLRCSPGDNCVERFKNCPHHRKQTHYHCLKRGCDKVYISTSDVQMHANYHRKDTAIIQEGFQRFRATENCLLESCAFFGQKTTHFHCRRDSCNHTFKNKADMEKHKSYHIRDEQLARDGFKKFMKHETCTFSDCRSSRVCNHIHCIRAGCTHVLHSTGQLYPHKRKHERRDNELAYRKYRLAVNIHKMPDTTNGALTSGFNLDVLINEGPDHFGEDDPTIDTIAAQLPLAQISTISIEEILGDISESRCLRYLHRHNQTNGKCRFEPDDRTSDDHFSCLHCNVCWSQYSDMVEHAKKHVVQDEATPLMFEETTDLNVCTNECNLGQNVRHFHCRMYGCIYTIPIQDKTLSKLEHYKFHEEQHNQFLQAQEELSALGYSKNTHSPTTPITIKQLLQIKLPIATKPISTEKIKPEESKPKPSPTLQVFPTGTTLTSIDGMPVLKRKRGRPPKNRHNEILSMSTTKPSKVNVNSNLPKSFTPLGPMSAFDLATAFNLPLKHASVISNIAKANDESSKTIPIPLIMPYLKSSMQDGFYVFDEETPCPDVTCKYFAQKHFHCSKPRCYYSTNREEILHLHSKDFHDNIDIIEGFVYFDENVDCKLQGCVSNQTNKHFHCTRANCNFSFVRYSSMATHEEKHRNEALHNVEQLEANPNTHLNDDENETSMAEDYNSANSHFSHKEDLVNQLKQPQFNEFNFTKIEKEDEKLSEDVNGSRNDQTKDLSMLHSLQKLFHEQAKMSAFNALASIPPNPVNPNGSKHYMYSESNPCNSPFCKLKRRNHFHCNNCNQAFSSFNRLLPHSLKHVGTLTPIPVYPSSTTDHNESAGEEPDDKEENDSQLLQMNLQNQFAQNPELANNFLQILMNSWMTLPSTSTTINSLLQFGPMMGSNFSPNNFIKNIDSVQHLQKRRNSFSSDSSNNECSKKLKADDESVTLLSNNNNNNKNSPKSVAKSSFEESSPNGYLRFRFNEDCGFSSCVYREHQTHFHCMRKDCGYSFCDKTRFVQHTARHERLDSLMGGDFHQFRSTVSCGQLDCIYSNVNSPIGNKTSHFHCLKCEYVCADTNKVVAHRRQHAKMDNISAAGFEKYSPSQDCQKEMCNYKLKQTHYHCLTCNYSVLGLSQMSSHKFKHQQQHE